jgi:hypothetical protein
LEQVILGIQGWIRRHSEDARRMAAEEENPDVRENLERGIDYLRGQGMVVAPAL